MNNSSCSPLLSSLARLVVYQKALGVAQLVVRLDVSGSLGDQLSRAASSLVLNIAEGAGERTRATKRRYYAIARGSLFEVGAALDLVALRRVDGALAEIAPLLEELDRILSALMRR